jgi:hypothetical protein
MSTRAERNRNRTDGCYCWRCGDTLEEAKAVWLVADLGMSFHATEADAGEENMGGFPFGSACAKRQLKADAPRIAA